MKNAQISLRKRFLSAIIFIISLSIYAANINYDQARNNYSGSESNRLQQVINNASSGDVILFNSTNYNFGTGNITLNKGIELRGLAATNYSATNQGANGVRTVLNLGRLDIKSNNITLRRLDIRGTRGIIIDARHPNYINKSGDFSATYSNINLFNCFIRSTATNGSSYGIHGGNGIGGTLRQVTCLNFTFAALNFDRKGPVNDFPNITVDLCRFQPRNPVGFNDWAVSFDAGNSDYPIVWNAKGTTISNSTFVNTGVAYSKIRNSSVTNCTFIHNRDEIEPIHIEEFSNDIDIIGNTFNCNTANGITNVIGLDREFQFVDNIDILRNTVNGNFKTFVKGYSNTNIRINNNIFGPTATCTGDYTIDFEFNGINFRLRTDGQPQLPNFPASGIVIRGNQRIMQNAVRGNNGVLRIWTQNGGSTGLDTNIANGYITRENAGSGPTQLITEGTYFIQNSQGRLQDFNVTPRIVSNTSTGNFVRWRVRRVGSYRYTIQNIATNQYLEAREVYTDNEICKGLEETFSPRCATNWTNDETQRPRWLIQRFNANQFVLYPGANEIKSMLTTAGGTGSNAILDLRLEDGTPTDTNSCPRRAINLNTFPNNRFRWSFIPVTGSKSLVDDSLNKEKISVSPTSLYKGSTININVIDTQISTINIFDLNGSLVLSTQTDHDLILETSNFANSNGIYIIEITTDKQDSIVQKIIIQ